MKFNKIFIFVLLFIISIFIVNSALTDNNQAYYKFDVNSASQTDSTGNGHTATVVGATFTSSGKINNAYSYDGVNDYTTLYQTSIEKSLSFWTKINSLTSTGIYHIIDGGDSGANMFQFTIRGDLAGDPLEIYASDGTNYKSERYNFPFSDTTNYHHFIVILDGNDIKFYVNNVEQTSTSSGGTATGTLYIKSSSSNKLSLGRRNSAGDRYFSGYIDEFSLWNETLNTTQISLLFNSNIGLQHPYSLDVPIIQSNLSQYYNITNISIQLNTTSNVNMSYILDLNSEVSICNDCNNSILNLTSLSELSHNITFISKNDNGVINNTESFIIDITAPNIQVLQSLTTTNISKITHK